MPASFPPPGPRLSPSTCDPRPTARRSKRLRACMCVVRDRARRPFAGAPPSRGRRVSSRGRRSQGLAPSESASCPHPAAPPARRCRGRSVDGGRRTAASAPHPQASRRADSAPAADPACGRGGELHRGPALPGLALPAVPLWSCDRAWVVYAPAGPRFLHPYNGSVENDDLSGLFQGLGARIPECRVWPLVGYV